MKQIKSIFKKKFMENKQKLTLPFLIVETETGASYGGSQKWFPYGFLKRSGCGVIGAANVICCIRGKRKITKAEYMDISEQLWKRDLPVLPGIGMNGLTLMVGMNRYLKRAGLPYRAAWKISRKTMLSRIDQMLAEELPVILSIGPNAPKIWGKESVSLYQKSSAGQMIVVTKTKAHFVTVTGREERWLRISSWGKEYYIDWNELKEYIAGYSSSLVSNILYISKKKV